MRTHLVYTVVLSIAAAILLAAVATAPVQSGDEMAWVSLVAITDTHAGATTPGESTAGWRFWTTRSELFPNPELPGYKVPVRAVFDRYRPLDFMGEPTLISAVNDLQARNYHGFSFNPNEEPAPEEKEMISLNPEVAGFVIDHKLYWRESMIDYVYTKNHGIHLPAAAREIKTKWRKLNDADNPTDYITGSRQGVRYGLIAIHMQSHELRNSSLWATWIHEKYLSKLNGYPATDSFGGAGSQFPSKDLSTLLTRHSQRSWLKYRLIGTQVSFTHRPSLGNPLIEGSVFPDLRESSCITCHAQAAIQSDGYWSVFTKQPIGKAIKLPPDLASLDFDFTLAIAPKCEQGTGHGCTEMFELKGRVKKSQHKR